MCDADAEALHDADSFRATHCYCEATDRVLRRYEVSLRALFEVYSLGDGAIGDKYRSKHHLGHDEWAGMMADFDLVVRHLPAYPPLFVAISVEPK